MQQPELKKISELLSMEFFIPSYQRGYRWTKFEVRELLDDLKQLTEKTHDTKYCLQPLIVKKIENKNNCYEVIDGQQRLTTIYLIMKFVSTLIPNKSLKEYYTIEYETRQDSKNFLENINTSNSFMDTPDFYYMRKAYDTISGWFGKPIDEKKQELGDNIDKFLKENVFVIFYNVDSGTDSMELFRKVNIGKIPLTSSELIKALLLTSIEDKDKQYRIAYEWDLIEQNLQNESLWYFLCNDAKDNNRIELLFDIYADRINADKDLKVLKEQKYFEFIVVYKALKKKLLTPDEIWTEIKNINSNISNWYNDIDNYHMIGFLLAIKSKKTSQEKIKEYIKATYQKNKSDIREFFIKEIKNNLNINNNDDIEEISEYAYDDKVKIRKLLLLFNIATLILRSEKQYRFSFEIYKKNSWDIEHIHATNDSSAEADNLIQNLTLLDSGTNRAYKDKPFNEKRAIIIEKEKYGQFIPLCTKNVFLKQYTENVKDMKDWNEDDKQCYVAEIKNIIKEFLLGDK